MGVVMVYNSRKVVVGYADTHGSCSVGHYGLCTESLFRLRFEEAFFIYSGEPGNGYPTYSMNEELR
jgi:hypothetical protein